jgi:hypothetical protein
VFRLVRLGCEHGYKYYDYPDMKKKIVGETFIGEKWFGHTLHSPFIFYLTILNYFTVLENERNVVSHFQILSIWKTIDNTQLRYIAMSY